ncbi:MAG: methyltransferase domain-containing protein [Pseudomonadota bacterium]
MARSQTQIQGSILAEDAPARARYFQGIIDYYSEAGMDYEPWSRRFNMHFGYYRWGLNPFNREQMLDEMNQQVLNRLKIDPVADTTLADLGCGVGTSARYAIRTLPNADVIAATIVPWQIELGQQLSTDPQYQARLSFRLADYCDTGLPDNSLDGAYAIESACYDEGKSKRAFLAEAFRILKPGARLAVADGFTKGTRHTKLFTYLYRKVCDGWALQDFAGIDAFTAALEDIGFEDIRVEEASWRVALSVAYVPWVSLKYFFKSIFRKKSDTRIQKGHFIAPVYGVLMGLHRRQYGYHIVSARKPLHLD